MTTKEFEQSEMAQTFIAKRDALLLEVSEKTVENEKLEAVNTELIGSNAIVKQELSNANEQIDGKRKEYTELVSTEEKKISKLEKEVSIQEDKKSKLLEEVEELKNKKKSFKSEIDELSECVKSAKEILAETVSSFPNLLKQITEEVSVITTSAREVDELTQHFRNNVMATERALVEKDKAQQERDTVQNAREIALNELYNSKNKK